MENQNSKPEIRQAAKDILLLLVDIMDLACDKGFTLHR
jgi:hypothetical protein